MLNSLSCGSRFPISPVLLRASAVPSPSQLDLLLHPFTCSWHVHRQVRLGLRLTTQAKPLRSFSNPFLPAHLNLGWPNLSIAQAAWSCSSGKGTTIHPAFQTRHLVIHHPSLLFPHLPHRIHHQLLSILPSLSASFHPTTTRMILASCSSRHAPSQDYCNHLLTALLPQDSSLSCGLLSPAPAQRRYLAQRRVICTPNHRSMNNKDLIKIFIASCPSPILHSLLQTP